ncbi:hypothetical protein [Halomonas cupida]|uniref:hypothetical protein n=1 Tax=Halomonas cupida TaxID=44933 RepID=UPI0039B3F735
MTAALKMAKRDYERMAIADLREFAHQQHDEHDPEATRVYVNRLAHMEWERREIMERKNEGYHPASPGFGDGTGASTKAKDAMYLAYIHGITNSPWHDHAKRHLNRLPLRRLMALMFCTAKIDARTDPNNTSPWSREFQHIAECSPHYAQLAGFTPGEGKGLFKDARSIKNAAQMARMDLIAQARVGVI